MIDTVRVLEAVVRGEVPFDGEHAGITAAVAVPATSGDAALAPRPPEVLGRFHEAGNLYSRNLVAGTLAGGQEPAALLALLRTPTRDLGDERDSFGLRHRRSPESRQERCPAYSDRWRRRRQGAKPSQRRLDGLKGSDL
jgi:hypothetical protein